MKNKILTQYINFMYSKKKYQGLRMKIERTKNNESEPKFFLNEIKKGRNIRTAGKKIEVNHEKIEIRRGLETTSESVTSDPTAAPTVAPITAAPTAAPVTSEDRKSVV